MEITEEFIKKNNTIYKSFGSPKLTRDTMSPDYPKPLSSLKL